MPRTPHWTGSQAATPLCILLSGVERAHSRSGPSRWSSLVSGQLLQCSAFQMQTWARGVRSHSLASSRSFSVVSFTSDFVPFSRPSRWRQCSVVLGILETCLPPFSSSSSCVVPSPRTSAHRVDLLMAARAPAILWRKRSALRWQSSTPRCRRQSPVFHSAPRQSVSQSDIAASGVHCTFSLVFTPFSSVP